MTKKHDFYSDYERLGEKGIMFTQWTNSKPLNKFLIWDGFFDPIMQSVHEVYYQQKKIPYIQLLREWNECLGYAGVNSEKSTVQIGETVQAFKNVNLNLLSYEDKPDYTEDIEAVLSSLIEFLEEARKCSNQVTIEEV